MAETVTINIPTDPALADLVAQVSSLASQVSTLSSQLTDMRAQLGKFTLVNPFAPAFGPAFGSGSPTAP
jgi:hypothetical protein